jgi:hypothetical protein
MSIFQISIQILKKKRDNEKNIPEKEPDWNDILPSKYRSGIVMMIIQYFWNLSPGISKTTGSLENTYDLGDLGERMRIFSEYLMKSDDKKTRSTCIHNIVHPKVSNIDYVEFIENGSLTMYSNGQAYDLFKPETNAGEEMYNCRFEVDNMIGPKIVDGNNNLVWGMMTHDTSISKAPLNRNDQEKTRAILTQMYFNRLSNHNNGKIITSDKNGNIMDDSKYWNILYGPSKLNNGFYLKTSAKYEATPDSMRFGNFVLTLYKDRLSFEGYSSYTGKLVIIWEYMFKWKSPPKKEYYVVLYQKLYGKSKILKDVDFKYDRTDGDLYVSIKDSIEDLTLSFTDDNGNEKGNEIETLSFKDIFGFDKIKGAAFTFDNTGPSLKYANMLIWHPLFDMSNDDMLKFFDNYCHVGHLMMNLNNVKAFDLDDYKNIEPFSNQNNQNNKRTNERTNKQNNIKNNKKNSESRFVYSQPLINNSNPYLDTENVEDCCSIYGKYQSSDHRKNVMGKKTDLSNKNAERHGSENEDERRQRIRNDIEQFDNLFGSADFNFYYNKYRNKVSKQTHLDNKEKEPSNRMNNMNTILKNIIEDHHYIFKLILWCVLILLFYIIVRKLFV